MGVSEVYSGMQTGVIDGAENNPPTFIAHNYMPIAKNYTPQRPLHYPGNAALLKVKWDKLSADEQQKILTSRVKRSSNSAREPRSQARSKLYVQRVFIMDDAEQFMPNYLRFVRGLIDSNDLPLNVSREILQDSTVTRNLRNALTKRTLQMLEKLAKDDAEKYQTFWKQFGLVLKEGPAEDTANVEAIAKLLRFASTHTDLRADRVAGRVRFPHERRAGEDLHITADSYAAAKSSPHPSCCVRKVSKCCCFLTASTSG